MSDTVSTVQPAGASRQFKIQGMDCAEEVAVLKDVVGPAVGGADRLSFDVLNGKMVVDQTAAAVPDGVIMDAVRRTGMRAEQWQVGSLPGDVAPERRRRTLLTTASGVLLAAAFALHAWMAGGLSYAFGSEGLGVVAHVVPLAARALYGLSIVCGAWFIAPKAWYSLRSFRPDMNLLMMIAVVGAIVIGEWLEAATVAFLFSVSLALESWSVGRARRAVEALLDLAPPVARVQRDGAVLELPLGQVEVGSTGFRSMAS